MKNEDTRVQYTKKVLKDALLRLLQSKPIAKVSIKELCEEAGLNRGTFYLHYNEPNDVLMEIEGDFIREKMSFLDPYLKDDNPDQLAKLFEAVLSNSELSLILFGRNGAPQFTSGSRPWCARAYCGNGRRSSQSMRARIWSLCMSSFSPAPCS